MITTNIFDLAIERFCKAIDAEYIKKYKQSKLDAIMFFAKKDNKIVLCNINIYQKSFTDEGNFKWFVLKMPRSIIEKTFKDWETGLEYKISYAAQTNNTVSTIVWAKGHNFCQVSESEKRYEVLNEKTNKYEPIVTKDAVSVVFTQWKLDEPEIRFCHQARWR